MQSISPYNLQQKNKYIDYEGVNKKLLTSLFRRTATKEEEYNTDIAEMNHEQLIDTLSSMNMVTHNYKSQTISLLKAYISWVVLSGRPGSMEAINLINASSIDSHDTLVSTMIKDPDQLRNILDSISDYIDYKNRSTRDTLVFWLSYCGIELKDIAFLKKNSIHYERKVILINDKEVKINDEFSNDVVDFWRKVEKMEYIEKRNGRAETTKNRLSLEYAKCDLADNEYLFRNTKSKSKEKIISYSTLRLIVSKKITEYNHQHNTNISYKNIRDSGLFYNLYTLECKEEEITLELIANLFGISNYRNKHELYLRTKYINENYNDWKIAFGYDD